MNGFVRGLTIFRKIKTPIQLFLHSDIKTGKMNEDNDHCTFKLLKEVGLIGENVHIKDKFNVEKLVQKIIDDGFRNLQVIADFDQTITKYWVDGKRVESSFCVVDQSEYMPSFCHEETDKLFKKYYPKEIDPHLSEEEKTPYMIEWYNQSTEVYKRCNILKDNVEKMAEKGHLVIRDGTASMFKQLHSESVPVLIFSAGVGDILEHKLRAEGIYTDNVKVVSNFFNYSDDGVMIGYKGPVIHVMNKNGDGPHFSDYFVKHKNRMNVILLGDSLGDTRMMRGIPKEDNVLKIGFLNVRVDERMETYLNAFDIVLTNDETMNIARSILSKMA